MLLLQLIGSCLFPTAQRAAWCAYWIAEADKYSCTLISSSWWNFSRMWCQRCWGNESPSAMFHLQKWESAKIRLWVPVCNVHDAQDPCSRAALSVAAPRMWCRRIRFATTKTYIKQMLPQSKNLRDEGNFLRNRSRGGTWLCRLLRPREPCKAILVVCGSCDWSTDIFTILRRLNVQAWFPHPRSMHTAWSGPAAKNKQTN